MDIHVPRIDEDKEEGEGENEGGEGEEEGDEEGSFCEKVPAYSHSADFCTSSCTRDGSSGDLLFSCLSIGPSQVHCTCPTATILQTKNLTVM